VAFEPQIAMVVHVSLKVVGAQNIKEFHGKEIRLNKKKVE
jgi:hypothetical protein